MPKTYKNPGPITFTATMEGSSSGAWVIFPYDLKETYGVGNLVPMVVTFDDKETYTGSIAKMGPEPMILIKKEIQERLGKKTGEPIKVTVTLDDKPRVVEVPQEMKTILKQHPEVQDMFDKFSYTHQKEYVRWITEAKQEETKQRRLAQLIDMIRAKKTV